MPDRSRAPSRTAKRRTRRPAPASEQVDQLCRLWRTVLSKRDALSEAARAQGADAAKARASLSGLEAAALADYLAAQRGQQHLKRIVDRWCGDQRVEALRVLST